MPTNGWLMRQLLRTFTVPMAICSRSCQLFHERVTSVTLKHTYMRIGSWQILVATLSIVTSNCKWHKTEFLVVLDEWIPKCHQPGNSIRKSSNSGLENHQARYTFEGMLTAPGQAKKGIDTEKTDSIRNDPNFGYFHRFGPPVLAR